MKEFNCVFQYDAMQCGAACLTMVCNYFGIDCSLTDISQLCPANAEGVSLYGLKKPSVGRRDDVCKCTRRKGVPFPYEPDKTLTVELFTWEKLDYVDAIKEKLF